MHATAVHVSHVFAQEIALTYILGNFTFRSRVYFMQTSRRENQSGVT